MVLSLIDVSPLLINSLIWSVLISSNVRLLFFNSPNSSTSVIFFFVPFRHSRRCVCWGEILSTSGVMTFSFLISDCFSICFLLFLGLYLCYKLHLSVIARFLFPYTAHTGRNKFLPLLNAHSIYIDRVFNSVIDVFYIVSFNFCVVA